MEKELFKPKKVNMRKQQERWGKEANLQNSYPNCLSFWTIDQSVVYNITLPRKSCSYSAVRNKVKDVRMKGNLVFLIEH